MGTLPAPKATSAVSTARRRSELNTAARSSSRRRASSSRACSRPQAESRLWVQPDAMPSSLSSLSECVSKTIVIATALAGARRSDGASVHGLDLDDIAGVRCGDHLAPADVQADVLAATWAPEDEVTRLHGVQRH